MSAGPKGLARLIVTGPPAADTSEEVTPTAGAGDELDGDDRFTDLAGEMLEAFKANDVASLATLLRAVAGEGSAK